MSDLEILTNPLLVCQEVDDSKIQTIVIMRKGWDHRMYGLVICDAVRHVARAYGVSENEVWEVVDRERHTPTSTLSTLRREGMN